ncbi:18860_t:CDS:2 [Entrophospora sp. SA101]|nr:18860_t:CDS:2 [Entrophospora sp. SA101]
MSNRKPKTRCFSMDNKYNDISTPTTADMIKNGSLLALSAGNAFSNYAPVVGAICGLCEMIIKLYDTIKENKVISRALINRVELAHVAIKQMEREKEANEENFRKESYFKAFNRLEAVLKNIKHFIKHISSYGGFKKFFNADHIKKCYDDQPNIHIEYSKRHIDYKDNISPNINDGKPKKRCIDDKDDNITTMDTIKNVSLLVLSTGDAFTNYVPILKTICDLCETIIRLYDTIKENKTISIALIHRVELAHVAIKQMEREKEANEENFRKESYFKAFNRLEAVLKNIKHFIKHISSYGGFKKFFNADHIKKCYDDHVKNLEGACADLQFNVILSNDVKLSHRKDTDVRGANKRVVKKILRKTVEVACKTILHYPKDDGTSESKKFQAKLAILNAIQCKYIIKFYGISNVNSHNALIFGWAEKGNLKDLYNTHYIDWVTKLKISYDVIRGLLFMHNGEILHHDVKCENILIDEDGNAKVSNFELSRNLSGETSRISNLNDYIPWLAPEKIESGTQLYNLDSWEHSPHNRPSFDEIKNELAESWKCFENTKYVAKFIAKDEVSNDKIQHHNIDKDSDFKP